MVPHGMARHNTWHGMTLYGAVRNSTVWHSTGGTLRLIRGFNPQEREAKRNDATKQPRGSQERSELQGRAVKKRTPGSGVCREMIGREAQQEQTSPDFNG